MKILAIFGASIAIAAVVAAQSHGASEPIAKAGDDHSKCAAEQFSEAADVSTASSMRKLTEVQANLPAWLEETNVPATSVAYI